MSKSDLDTYQDEVRRTMAGRDDTRREKLLHFTLGLCGEAGEVAELCKKTLFYDRGTTIKELTLELGDVLWYVTALASLLHVPLSAVTQANTDKLRKRYPDGYTKEAARLRADEEGN